MVRTLRVRIRFRRPSLPHCGQGAFLGPQGIGITTTVGASVPMLVSLVRGGLSTTTFHQGACPNVQAQNGFEPPTIRWRSSRSLKGQERTWRREVTIPQKRPEWGKWAPPGLATEPHFIHQKRRGPVTAPAPSEGSCNCANYASLPGLD